MATNGFTKCYNSVLFDLNLSIEAIGLYAKIKYMSTIENFKIKRDYVKSISGYGETAFRRVWKELKEKKVLIENKTRNMGRYEYEFYLADENEITNNTIEEKKEVEKEDKHVDSDGNTPIDGQVYIDDIQNENVKELKEKTELSTSECVELLKCTGNDINIVIDYYNYTIRQKSVGNVFKYVRACVLKKFKIPVINQKQKGHFNNFKQRAYDFDKLEQALLYGEQYELPV